MDSNVVLALADADDEVVAIVAEASGDHFRSSNLLASETADADAAAAGRPAVMIQVFGAVNCCANGAEYARIMCGGMMVRHG